MNVDIDSGQNINTSLSSSFIIWRSGGIEIVARVVQVHVVHLPRLHVHLPDNGTQLIDVRASFEPLQ